MLKFRIFFVRNSENSSVTYKSIIRSKQFRLRAAAAVFMYKHCLNCSSYARRIARAANNNYFSNFLGISCVFAVRTSAVLSATSSSETIWVFRAADMLFREKRVLRCPKPKNWGIPKRERRGKCAKHPFPDFCGAKKIVRETVCPDSQRFKCIAEVIFLCVCGNL